MVFGGNCARRSPHPYAPQPADHGAPIYPRNLNRDLTKLLADAKIRHFTVHDFRHAAATLALADKVPAPYIAAMLGHSNVKTTLSMYANKALPKCSSMRLGLWIEFWLVTDFTD